MKRTLLILLLCTAGSAPAQETWPLERCIAYALEHNTGIRQQRLEVEVRKAELLQMQAASLPVLRAGIAQEYNWGRSVDMQELVIIRNKLTRATGASVTASLPLFEGFSQHYGRLAAKKAVEAARSDSGRQREELSVEITRAYLQLLLARQILSYRQESLTAITGQRERTARLVEAGSQPKTALSEMEAQLASEKAALVEASCRVRSATLALTRLMNLPQGESFTASEDFGTGTVLETPPSISEAQLEDYLREDPGIRSAEAVLEQTRYKHSQAKSAFLPGLRLSASYGTYYSSASDEAFRTQLDENRNPSLSIQLDIPVFQAFQAGTRLRKSRLACEQARLELEKVRTRVADEVRSAVIEAENSCQQFHSSEETLRA
ncbi:MAG: TolC family protein, partial [Bacteroidales bacterium]|nr:TolC family protein [Bacteroidales bacterium]